MTIRLSSSIVWSNYGNSTSLHLKWNVPYDSCSKSILFNIFVFIDVLLYCSLTVLCAYFVCFNMMKKRTNKQTRKHYSICLNIHYFCEWRLFVSRAVLYDYRCSNNDLVYGFTLRFYALFCDLSTSTYTFLVRFLSF